MADSSSLEGSPRENEEVPPARSEENEEVPLEVSGEKEEVPRKKRRRGFN